MPDEKQTDAPENASITSREGKAPLRGWKKAAQEFDNGKRRKEKIANISDTKTEPKGNIPEEKTIHLAETSFISPLDLPCAVNEVEKKIKKPQEVSTSLTQESPVTAIKKEDNKPTQSKTKKAIDWDNFDWSKVPASKMAHFLRKHAQSKDTTQDQELNKEDFKVQKAALKKAALTEKAKEEQEEILRHVSPRKQRESRIPEIAGSTLDQGIQKILSSTGMKRKISYEAEKSSSREHTSLEANTRASKKPRASMKKAFDTENLFNQKQFTELLKLKDLTSSPQLPFASPHNTHGHGSRGGRGGK